MRDGGRIALRTWIEGRSRVFRVDDKMNSSTPPLPCPFLLPSQYKKSCCLTAAASSTERLPVPALLPQPVPDSLPVSPDGDEVQDEAAESPRGRQEVTSF